MPRSLFVNTFNPKRRRDSTGSLEWWSYQQAFIPQLYFARPRVDWATLGQLPIPAGICCQATQDGGAICSNGQAFPPNCPNKPVPNVPGVAEYVQQEGYLVPKPPPAAVGGACPTPTPATPKPAEAQEGEGIGTGALVGLAAAGALVYALVEGVL